MFDMNKFINVYLENVWCVICRVYEMNAKNGEMYAKCRFSSALTKRTVASQKKDGRANKKVCKEKTKH